MTGLNALVDRLARLPAQQRDRALALLRDRGAEFGVLPLSGAQRRLWFLSELDEELPIYNVPYAFRLTGPLSVPALREALADLVRRHELLRASFFDIDGEPFQLVRPAIPPPFTIRDWNPAEELRPLLDAEARRPFDLHGGPLIRATLLTDGRGEHVLLLTLHHIICDGWSLAILLSELSSCYIARKSGSEPQLPAAGQFRDARTEPDPEHLRYWLDRLTGAPTTLDLPTDHPRPPVQRHRGAELIFTWPASLHTVITGFATQHRSTAFMTVLTGFAALLHRYTGARDLLIGVPVAGRLSLEAENVAGFFVNTVPLRVRPDPAMSFTALLAQLREATLAAQTHEQTPFDELVEALKLPRDLSRHPLVQACFVVLATENELLELPGLTCELVRGHTGTSKFDLTMSLIPVPGAGLRGVAEYDTDLFTEPTIRRLADDLRALLSAALADPDRQIGALALAGGER